MAKKLWDAIKELRHENKEIVNKSKSEALKWAKEGFSLIRLGRYEEALIAYDKSLNIVDNDAEVLIQQGNVYFKLGKYIEARTLYKKALEIYEQTSSSENSFYIEALNNLASLDKITGNYKEAESLYTRALAFNERIIEPNHPDNTNILNNLASLYCDLGKYDDAERYYKRSLAINENFLGSDHPNVANSLNNLAELYYKKGNPEDAEPLYNRALDIFMHILDPDHPEIAKTLNKLADLYENMGNREKALSLYQHALKVLKKSVGTDHPLTAQTSVKLAFLYEELNMYEEAKSLFQSSLDIYKRLPSSENHITIISNKIMELNYQLKNDKQTFENLHELITYCDNYIQVDIVRSLGSAFQYMSDSDKTKTWNYLHKLTFNEDYDVRSNAIVSIETSFPHLFEIDQKQALEDLHRLSSDENVYVRSHATRAICSVFKSLRDLDKEQIWNDLHRLTIDESFYIRYIVARSIGSIFRYLNKQCQKQAWYDIRRLVNDESVDVKSGIAYSLGYIFEYIGEEEFKEGCTELYNLTHNNESNIRAGAAYSLGIAFPYIQNKEEALRYLNELLNDTDKNVRIQTNHSLGRVSVYNASVVKTEEEYEKELKNAITFFEKSSEQSDTFNPSRFYLPFYRSLYTIFFKVEYSENEIKRDLAEAKSAARGSTDNEILYDIIEKLANLLDEIHNSENNDLTSMKNSLNKLRTYFEHNEEILDNTQKIAPVATNVIKKGLPILNITIKDIKDKLAILCEQSEGTQTEKIACNVMNEVGYWKIDSPEKMTQNIEDLVNILKSKISPLSENKNILNKIEEMRDEKDLLKQYESLLQVIMILPQINVSNSVPKLKLDNEQIKPTIGIITSLPKEYAAVSVLLENKNDKYKVPGSGAGRRYCLGEISSAKGNKHNLVLASVGMGNNIAATRASLLLEHFPSIRSIIMVGIAGGVPNPKNADNHVRLGDIVVSNENGIIQYDFMKQDIKEITQRNPTRPPSVSLLEAVKYLEAEEILGNRPWEKYIDQALSKIQASRPSEDKDVLYSFDNRKGIIKHPEDPKRRKGQPRVFIGPIASANILQKDPKARDELRDKFKVKAIEMEASGIADATWNHEVGYLVVRGICDYCDSHKNDEWQQYAAVVAAAYTRALIESMP